MKTYKIKNNREMVKQLVNMMMEANGTEPYNGTVYNSCQTLIVEMLAKETGLSKRDILNGNGRYGWNLGGNESYIVDVEVMLTGLLEERKAAERKEKAAQRRRGIKEAYESCGMVKVRGALGGVYYE